MKTTKWMLPALALLSVGLGCQTVMKAISPATPTPRVEATLPIQPEAGVTPPALTDQPAIEATASGNPSAAPTEYAVPDEGRYHIEFGQTAKYDHFPPSSGLHYGKILNWGFYNEAIPPEYWVHSLEHGGIVILYNCASSCKDTEDAIWQVVQKAPPEDQFNEVKILVTPNSQIDHKVVALAWDTELDLDEANYDILLDFYNRHVNQGPEAAP